MARRFGSLLSRVIGHKRYFAFGTYYPSKRNAQSEAAKLRKKGHLVRILTVPPADHLRAGYPRSLVLYQLWVTT